MKFEARPLSMGDAIWVAKCRNTGMEVVLDCCLERKRLDDLVTSMMGTFVSNFLEILWLTKAGVF